MILVTPVLRAGQFMKPLGDIVTQATHIHERDACCLSPTLAYNFHSLSLMRDRLLEWQAVLGGGLMAGAQSSELVADELCSDVGRCPVRP